MNEDTGEVKTFEDRVAGRGEIGKLEVPYCTDYTLRMKARELEGFKGFLILFGYRGEEDHFWWTIGGWQNQDTIVGERIHGRNSDLCQYQFDFLKPEIVVPRLSAQKVRGDTFSITFPGESFTVIRMSEENN